MAQPRGAAIASYGEQGHLGVPPRGAKLSSLGEDTHSILKSDAYPHFPEGIFRAAGATELLPPSPQPMPTCSTSPSPTNVNTQLSGRIVFKRLLDLFYGRANALTRTAAHFSGIWAHIAEWQTAFDHFDTGTSGTMDHRGLQRALRLYGYDTSLETIVALSWAPCVDGGPRIGFTEFMPGCLAVKIFTAEYAWSRRLDIAAVGAGCEEYIQANLGGLGR